MSLSDSKKSIFMSELRIQLHHLCLSYDQLSAITNIMFAKEEDPVIIIVWDLNAVKIRVQPADPTRATQNLLIEHLCNSYAHDPVEVSARTVFNFSSWNQLLDQNELLTNNIPWCLHYHNVPNLASAWLVTKSDTQHPLTREYIDHPFYRPFDHALSVYPI
ncbi:hypothetical protein SAMD00019534_084700 [Acytostelium subglobosum LB1]|uniref:hypothetical protein n=1 Tax=Acytostelium subglobosum LB1 TaxID=1410327 RepID=UPI000645169D|nr:hypothetical protein SAMD00019534_084700 [Acytostelium subglobosum LB1]GAM25295.1 hypothetical protein SAMD00019534_084700 [Acytostelium subglobosum LB1]|eukprot:XP_012751815.1 hypothetical protein SAMD00019534_084700 [Acytostelium subglobosum LB1]